VPGKNLLEERQASSLLLLGILLLEDVLSHKSLRICPIRVEEHFDSETLSTEGN
jgi:hypothetical protein